MLRGMSVAYVCCGKNRNEVDRDSGSRGPGGVEEAERNSVGDRDDFWRALCT